MSADTVCADCRDNAATHEALRAEFFGYQETAEFHFKRAEKAGCLAAEAYGDADRGVKGAEQEHTDWLALKKFHDGKQRDAEALARLAWEKLKAAGGAL